MTEIEMGKIFTRIVDNFLALSGIVASEDSSLSGTCNNISATYRNLSGKLSSNIDEIKKGLKTYIGATIENETTTNENLTRTNEGLESAKSILDTL